MHLQHEASVLVTDGREALLFRNNGDAEFPDLHLVKKWEQQLEPDHALKSGPPGRAFGSHDHGMRRSSYEETNFHAQAKVDFARLVAEFLDAQLAAGAIHELILVAPPRTLGEIRKHARPATSKLIRAEIDKDLVRHPVAHIESLLAAYPEPE